MLINKTGAIIDLIVDHQQQILLRSVLCYLGVGVFLRHRCVAFDFVCLERPSGCDHFISLPLLTDQDVDAESAQKFRSCLFVVKIWGLKECGR